MDWVRWTMPAAAVLSAASPAQAVQYLTVAAAQKLAFPGASQFVEAHVIYQPSDMQAIERLSGQRVQTRGEQVWKAVAGNGQDADAFLGASASVYFSGLWSVDRISRGAMATCSIIHQTGQDPCFPLIALLLS